MTGPLNVKLLKEFDFMAHVTFAITLDGQTIYPMPASGSFLSGSIPR
jgi:hypothetical protein